MPCTVDGCTRPTHSRGWCRTHYTRWWRTGTVNAAEPVIPKRARCKVAGCEKRVKQRGYCSTHYYRWKRRGTTDRDYTPAERITDVLEIEGGWWTSAGLAVRLGCHADNVRRELPGLVDAGVLERRVVELSTSGGLMKRAEYAYSSVNRL